MSVTVKLRYVRHSSKKLLPYARLFKGQSLPTAINKSEIMPQHSAKFIHKALLMVQSAATQKEFQPEELVITAIITNNGPKVRRIRANARGRANKYQKHLGHLVVTVDQKVEKKPAKTTKTKKEHGTKD